MKKYLTFELFITPFILFIVYFFAQIGLIIGTILYYGSNFLIMLGIAIGGSIILRVVIELILVIFKIEENQREIINNLPEYDNQENINIE